MKVTFELSNDTLQVVDEKGNVLAKNFVLLGREKKSYVEVINYLQTGRTITINLNDLFNWLYENKKVTITTDFTEFLANLTDINDLGNVFNAGYKYGQHVNKDDNYFISYCGFKVVTDSFKTLSDLLEYISTNTTDYLVTLNLIY